MGIHATNILSVSHAAHCGRRPRVSPQQTIVFWLSKPFIFKDRPQEAVLLHFRISSISLILRADPCCTRLFPTPMQRFFFFQSFLNVQGFLAKLFFLSFDSFLRGFKALQPSRIFQIFSKSLATLASTTKYFTRFGRKGEGHARVSHPIIHFTLLCSAALRFAPLHSNHIQLFRTKVQFPAK